jgi:hypothetical protein
MKNTKIKKYIYKVEFEDFLNLIEEEFIKKYLEKGFDFIYITEASWSEEYKDNYSLGINIDKDENCTTVMGLFEKEMSPIIYENLDEAVKDFLKTVN